MTTDKPNSSITRFRRVAGNARPALWIVTVCGKNVPALTPSLMDRKRFQQICFENGVFPSLPYGSDWDDTLRRLLAEAETVQLEDLYK